MSDARYSNRGVSFVIRIIEDPHGIAIYAALRNKLYVLAEENVLENSNMRVLGCLFDQVNDRIIVCMESYMSQIFKLTY